MYVTTATDPATVQSWGPNFGYAWSQGQWHRGMPWTDQFFGWTAQYFAENFTVRSGLAA